MPSSSVLRIALPVPLPQAFDYLPPPSHAPVPADVGKRVRVPFGSRELVGLVASVESRTEDVPELREALAVLDDAPLVHGELLDSLHWLARYTHAPLGEVFATALPTVLRQGEPLPDTHAWHWRLTEAGRTQLDRLRAGSRPRRLADLLAMAPLDEEMAALCERQPQVVTE